MVIWNNMTTSVLHALATGLPAITTNHGAFSEQIVEGKNGFMVDEGDYQALADKILFMMDHSELWPSFGHFGREHVEKNFNLGLLVDQQAELYGKIINKK